MTRVVDLHAHVATPDMGDEDVVGLVRSAELSDGAAERIPGGTAARLLKPLWATTTPVARSLCRSH